jgi:hypothetical protein
MRSHKWTFAVLGAAAFLGTVAAVGIQLAPSGQVEHAERASVPTVVPAAAPIANAGPSIEPAKLDSSRPDPAPVRVEQPAPSAPIQAPVERRVARKARVATPQAAGKKPAQGEGWLKATTRDVWAYVEVNGATFDTPHTFKLAPGTYKVRFQNDQYDLHKTCTATVTANNVEVIREDKCE